VWLLFGLGVEVLVELDEDFSVWAEFVEERVSVESIEDFSALSSLLDLVPLVDFCLVSAYPL